MMKSLLASLSVFSSLCADFPEWLYLEKSIFASEEGANGSLRVGTNHNIFLSNEDLFTTGISWNQFYDTKFSSSLGVGYRKVIGTNIVGVHHFLDVSNLSGYLMAQSGFSLEYFVWPFELRANTNIPWKTTKETHSNLITFHKTFDFHAFVFPMGQLKFGINPSYCSTNHQFGIKTSFRWFMTSMLSAELTAGHDAITKKTAQLNFHFGPGPNDSSAVAPVQRTYQVSHSKKIKPKKTPSANNPVSLIINPVKKDDGQVTFVGVDGSGPPDDFALKEGEKDKKTEEKKEPFFLWRLLGFSDSEL